MMKAKLVSVFFLLTIFFITACSGDGGSSDTKENLRLRYFNNLGPINDNNQSSYSFSGNCHFVGEGSYRFYSVEDENTQPIRGDFECAQLSGEWSVSNVNLQDLPQGEVVLEISSSDNSVIFPLKTLVKDIMSPTVEGIVNGDESWTWACSEADCQYHFVINDSTDAPSSIVASYSNATIARPISGPGSYYIHIQARDVAGNESTIVSSTTALMSTAPDTMAPQINGAIADAGNYRQGTDITITVSFNENVKVTGSPQLELRIGGSRGQIATFSGTAGASADSHEFTYTVGNNIDGAITVTGINLNGGSILDLASLPLESLGPGYSISDVIIDNTAPNISITKNDDSWFWTCSDSSGCEYRFAVSTQSSMSSITGNYSANATEATPSGEAGNYYVHVQVRDALGNESAVVSSSSYIYTDGPDITPPTVVGATAEAGLYRFNSRLSINLEFSEPVEFIGRGIGQFSLRVNVGGTTASCYTISNLNSFNRIYSFQCTVRDNYRGSPTILSIYAASAREFIQDRAENPLELDFEDISLPDVQFDAIRPVVTLNNDGTNWTWSCNETCTYRYAINQNSSHSFSDVPFDVDSTTVAIPNQVGTNYLYVQARDEAGNNSEVASNSYEFTGSLGMFTVTKDYWNWSWTCAPLNDCETRFAITTTQTPPSASAFSAYGDISQASVQRATGNYYIHLQARETSVPTNESSVYTHTQEIEVRSYLLNPVSLGSNHSCSFTDSPQCWGRNSAGQLGTNNDQNQDYPTTPVDISQISLSNILTVNSGDQFSCLLAEASDEGQQISCWGKSSFGRLGEVIGYDRVRPNNYVGRSSHDFMDISLGSEHSCGLNHYGRVVCWGRRDSGQLGNGTSSSFNYSTNPVTVEVSSSNSLKEVVQIAVGNLHSCAVKFDQTVWCWGNGNNGEIGDGNTSDRFYAQQVLTAADTPLTGIVQIDAGEAFSCGVKSDGGVWCWGSDEYGKRGGEIPTPSDPYATQISSLGRISEVSLGSNHACVLKASDRSIWCWGRDQFGQLARGQRNSTDNAIPAQVLSPVGRSGLGPYLTGASSINSGGDNSCVTGKFTRILCWGRGGYGQLGNNDTTSDSAIPVSVLSNTSPSTPLAINNFRRSYHCVEGRCARERILLSFATNSTTPGNNSTFSVNVSGIQEGESIKIYDNSSCSAIQLQTITADGDINLTTALEGKNTFYFTKNDSNCSPNYLSYTLDTTTPSVIGVAIPAGTYISNSNIEITVFFNEEVIITGNPQLTITGVGTASYVSSEGSRAIFSHTVTSGLNLNGVSLGSSLNLNDGGIEDHLSNSVSTTTLSLSNTQFSDVIINSVLPNLTLDPLQPLITSGNNANVSSYPLSGECESDVSIRVTVSGVRPIELSCSEGRYSDSIDLSRITVSEAIVQVAQTNGPGNSRSDQATLSVGSFAQKTFYHDKIVVSDRVSCRISPERQVYCWGINHQGVLGRGLSSNASTYYPPARVLDVGESAGGTNYLNNAVQIALRGGYFFATTSIFSNVTLCALVVENGTGKVRCWGYAQRGVEVGNLSLSSLTSQVPIPVAVKDGREGELQDIVQIALGKEHGCALKNDGEVYCWGRHDRGYLGIGPSGQSSGTRREASDPVMMENGERLSGIVQLASSVGVTCALNSSGNLFCWGRENFGGLGNGGSRDQTSTYAIPVRDHSGQEGTALSDVAEIFASHDSVNLFCARHTNNTMSCWGRLYDNTAGGQVRDVNHPILMREYGGSGQNSRDLDDIMQIGLGGEHGYGCMVRSNRRSYCWGRGNYGKLGNGSTSSSTPSGQGVTVLNLASAVVQGENNVALSGLIELTGNRETRCGVDASGTMYCWGRNDFGALGDNTTTNQSRATPVLADSSANTAPLLAGEGPGHSFYNCRDGYSRCFLQPVVLKPGPNQSNPNSNPNPVIDIIGLNEIETLTLYSDASCQTPMANGVLQGSSATQRLSLTNNSTTNETHLYYQISGNSTKESNVCFYSAMVLDRMAPADPTATYSINTDVSGGPPAINVTRNIRVDIDGGEDGNTFNIYTNDSTCSNTPSLGQLDSADPTYRFALDGIANDYADIVTTAVVNSIHIQIVDIPGNSSSCVEATLDDTISTSSSI